MATAVTFSSCVVPTGLAAPSLKSTTSSSITINWKEPTTLGGCDLLSYIIYSDQANATDIEVNSVNDANVRDKPGLSEF